MRRPPGKLFLETVGRRIVRGGGVREMGLNILKGKSRKLKK